MSSAQDRFRAEIAAAAETFEREHRTEITARGGDPDDDYDPFEHIALIADDWARTSNDPEARTALIDRLASELSLPDVRALRLASEAAAAVAPRLIYEDAVGGMSVSNIADDLDVTESYVYRILREARKQAVRPLVRAGVANDADPHASYERYAAMLATVPEEHRDIADAFLAEFRAALPEPGVPRGGDPELVPKADAED